MRSKIIFFLLLGLIVLALAVFRSRQPVPVPSASVEPATNSVETYPPLGAAAFPVPPPVPASLPTNLPPPPARTVEELQSLAMSNDADSLKIILAELTNPDPEIRAAARDAAVQFGDRTAAPTLRAVAAQTENFEEKQALLEAADFLELPPLAVPSATKPPLVR